MLTFSSFILALAVAAGCGSAGPKCTHGEAILFSKIGNAFFKDSVSVICPDGSQFGTLLAPRPGRSFQFASGNSLKNHVVVSVHELTSDHRVADRLYLFQPRTAELSPMEGLSGFVGFATISPEDNRVVFEFAPKPQGPLGLWTDSIVTRELRKLAAEEDASDRWPSWRDDGRELLFLKIHLTHSPPATETRLMRIAFPAGEPETVLGPAVGVVSATYSHDGKRFAIWSGNGLEIVDWAGLRRTVILPLAIANLQGRRLGSPGLIWARSQDILAFALFNPKTSESEIWVVRADGTGASPIFASSDGRILVGAFVRN